MERHYHTGRALAIVSGLAATAGAIGLLLADAIGTGHWSQDHALVPLVVGLTVATGHLASAALGGRRYLAALGFTVAFAIGTTVTVLGGVGRQSAVVGAHMAEAEAHNQAIADKAAELTRARLRLEQANAQAEREMTGSRCGPRCNDWKLRAAEVASHVRALEADLRRLGAARQVNPKAEKVGEIAAALGLDGKRAAALVQLLEPLLIPFLLEWTAIAALGYGFHGRRRSGALATVSDPPGGPGNRRRRPATETPSQLPANVVRLADKRPSDIVAALVAAGRPMTVSELATAMHVTKGEASKRWREAGNQVTVERSGRCLFVALAKGREVAA